MAEVFQKSMDSLRSSRINSTDLRDAIETMITLVRNILTHPNEEKFKRIKLTNAYFVQKVWNHRECQDMLLNSGWTRVKESGQEEVEVLRLTKNEKLEEFLKFLVDHRNVKPNVEEWKDETKFENIVDPNVAYEKERRMAVMANNEAYKKAQEEKQLKKQLAEQIKLEAKADREYRNIRKPLMDKELLSKNNNARHSSSSSSKSSSPDTESHVQNVV